MKGADGDIGHAQRSQPRPHLARRPRRERHRKGPPRLVFAGRYRVGDPMGDCPGLPRPCPREHDNRAGECRGNRPLLIIELLESRLGRRDRHWGTVASPAMKMYTTVWCGYCQRLKAQMAREGITFEEIDIEHDPQAAALVEAVNGGNQTVPTLVFDDGTAATNPSIGQVKANLGLA